MPSYESLYKNNKKSLNYGDNWKQLFISGNYNIEKNFIKQNLIRILIAKSKFTLGCFILFMVCVFLISPIINIFVGTYYKNSCPIEKQLPIWLIVDGLATFMLGFGIIVYRYCDIKLIWGIFSLFLFTWLIRGMRFNVV